MDYPSKENRLTRKIKIVSLDKMYHWCYTHNAKTNRLINLRKRSDGRWEGRYTAGHDPVTGKRITKNVLGKTQAEVRQKLKQAIENSQNLDMTRAGSFTVESWIKLWYEIYAEPRLREKTKAYYLKLYGWLPVAAPRDNLSQVLFAIGATVKTDLDGFLRIESFWDSVSSLVGKDRIYSGAKVGYSPTVTQVVVTEHQYAESQESEQLFEGTTAAGDIVTFNEPMHGLTAAGFSILDSGANWAKLSAGSGTLTGKRYLHNTRQISREVGEAETPNVKVVENATLISLVNSQATAERLANYYKWLETVDAAVVYRGEKPGDRVQVWHPYDNVETTACLQSADITLSNVLKAQEKALVGYVPPLPEAVVTYDNRAMLTGSGTWNVPAGVTMMRAVLIGGGQGGQGGFNGEPGADGRSASPIKGSYSSGAGGAGGKGGERGAGGQGGKVLIADITIPEGVTALTYTCGAGGASNGVKSLI